MSDKEYVSFSQLGEFTTSEDNGQRKIKGYAVVWGALSDPRKDGKRLRFMKGSIEPQSTVFSYWGHQIKEPVADTSDGSLKFSFDDKGVPFELIPDNTSVGNDTYTRVQNGRARGASPGGYILETKETKKGIIDIVRFELEEISITHRPAMTDTNVVAFNKLDPEKELKEESLDKIRIEIIRQKAELQKLELHLIDGRVSA